LSDDALEDFATNAGLEVQWTDAAGRHHKVTPEVLRSVLTALGYFVGNAQKIAGSERRLEYEKNQVPRLVTAWVGEDISVAGKTYRAPEVTGYHEIEINGAATTVAVAPRRCFNIEDIADLRMAGLAVQLYGLRGGHSGGFGDFSALAEFSSRAAAHGIDAVAISPVHALFPDEPAHISPYSPSSRIFLNPLYADVGVIGGTARRDDGRNGLIDWRAASAEKFADLRNTHDNFDPVENDAFIRFCEDGGERLHRHALFEALDAYFRAKDIFSWRDWPVAYRDPAHQEVLRFATAHQNEIEFRLFLQFLAVASAESAQKQARGAGMKIGLIADIATGIDANGSDCWAAPDDALKGLRIGAPPDAFNAAGQEWGITTLSPVELRRNGFGPFIAMLRANMGFAGGVRIDHAMGLMRLWVIPEGGKSADGVYLRYPLPDLLRLISLESHRARSIVIGEDLGTVPQGFSQTLAYRGIYGMQVLWFEQEQDGNFIAPSRWRRDAVAMTTTHDLPTVAGWWIGRDIDWRAKVGIHSSKRDESAGREERKDSKRKLWSALIDAHCVTPMPEPSEPEPVVDGAVEFAGTTPCRLALLPAEDVLGLQEQPNLPGTIDEHPNWRRRLPSGDFFSHSHAGERLARFVSSRRE
jgi:4-alpha-glucanotransferase